MPMISCYFLPIQQYRKIKIRFTDGNAVKRIEEYFSQMYY